MCVCLCRRPGVNYVSPREREDDKVMHRVYLTSPAVYNGPLRRAADNAACLCTLYITAAARAARARRDHCICLRLRFSSWLYNVRSVEQFNDIDFLFSHYWILLRNRRIEKFNAESKKKILNVSGIATQTILTIPVSHVSTNNQIVNLALSNGQVVSTTLANLQSIAQPQGMMNTPTNNGKRITHYCAQLIALNTIYSTSQSISRIMCNTRLFLKTYVRTQPRSLEIFED